ncbi:uncharacterized protein [Spinacia oleracea]|uniref:Ubiquitin-like protease family profile domain-containing protein n=1 Tax=Spinacia oleracea TaxID=3562 RepID=A0ABM3QKX7_SPIOL|nr:uncharacterized protein LOC110797024 [Spinacia oleracea]
MDRGDEEPIASEKICENTSKIEHMQSDEVDNPDDSSLNSTSTEENNTNTKEDHIQTEKDDNPVVSELNTAATEENSTKTDGSKKKNEDEKSHANNQKEVIVTTDNEETDDDDDEKRNEDNERENPRSSTGWENVKKSTLCPGEKKGYVAEEDDEDENNVSDEDENTDGEGDEKTGGDEDESEKPESPTRQKVDEQIEIINKDEFYASAPKRMIRKFVAAKTRLQPLWGVKLMTTDAVKDPVEEEPGETDDDTLLSQFKVSRTQPPKKRTKKEKEANREEEEKPLNKRKREQFQIVTTRDKGKGKLRKIEEDDDDCLELLEIDEDAMPIVPKKKKAKVVLYQKVPPTQLIELIKILPETHKAAIRKIGFGGFLSLSMANHNSALAEYLVTSCNVDKESIILPQSGEIFIKPEDIHLVYGVPLGGEEIQEPENEDIDDNYVEFLRTWRTRFKLKKGSPTNLPLIARIKDLAKQPVCDEFIWNFVIAAVNSCMRSTTNPQLYIKFMYSCMNVNTIANLDWSAFVYKHWKKSVTEWKAGVSFYTGPLPFLLIVYFDRLQRVGQQVPREVPLLSVWNRERMIERIIIEKARGFGQGVVLERMGGEAVVLRNVVPNVQVPPTREAPNMEGTSSNSKTEMMDFLEKFGTLAKTLASNVSEMYIMLDQAHGMFNEEEMIEKMQSLVENIWIKYTSKKQNQSQNQPEEDKKNKTPTILSQDQHLLNEPAFIEELDNLMENA